MIVINLTMATICFLGSCHPILYGEDTPTGTFTIIERRTQDPGYSGAVIQFHETKHTIYAIHTVWTLRPEEGRMERIRNSNVEVRKITNGCINVEPEVFQSLMNCCINQPLKIEK